MELKRPLHVYLGVLGDIYGPPSTAPRWLSPIPCMTHPSTTMPSMTPAFPHCQLRSRRHHSSPPYLLGSMFFITFTGPTIIHLLLSARVSSVRMASAHLLSPVKLPICSDTITGLNSSTTVTLMFDPYPLSNLSLAINLAMTSHTSYLIHLTLSVLTPQFPASHLLASLAISTSAAFIFERRTASSSTHVNMPPRQPLCKQSSMAPSVSGSLLIKIGSMPTLLIQSCRRLSRLIRTLASFPTNHLRNPTSTQIIVWLCANLSSLSKMVF